MKRTAHPTSDYQPAIWLKPPILPYVPTAKAVVWSGGFRFSLPEPLASSRAARWV